MLNAAERPLIVAGGGIINADASDLLAEFAEITGVPVMPTLMGWGTIPDDHPLMAGMCGLQTIHRYGNATMLASDFVLGVGNRWANRHTGYVADLHEGPQVRSRRYRANPDRPRFRAGFRHRLGCRGRAEAFARRSRPNGGRQASCETGRAWADECRERKRTMLRKTHFDQTPLKPQRVYEEMNKAFGRDTCYVSTIGRQPDRRRRSSCTSTSRATGSIAVRPGRSAGRCRPRSACVPRIPTGRSLHFPATTISSS